MIKFMRNVKPHLYPKVIRTILNFIRYHMLIRQIYYKDNDRELLAELMRTVADGGGFNVGVEHFWLKYHAKHENKRYKTRKELKRLANEIIPELEDIQASKIKEEQMRLRQEKIKEANLKRRRPEYDRSYKPSVNELLNKETALNEMKFESFSYKLYDVREKGAYVALILVEGDRPIIFCGANYKDVRKSSFSKWLELTKDQKIEQYKRDVPKKESKKQPVNEEFDINISHVERAMGIRRDNTTTNQDDINDLLDGLF